MLSQHVLKCVLNRGVHYSKYDYEINIVSISYMYTFKDLRYFSFFNEIVIIRAQILLT